MRENREEQVWEYYKPYVPSEDKSLHGIQDLGKEETTSFLASSNRSLFNYRFGRQRTFTWNAIAAKHYGGNGKTNPVAVKQQTRKK